MDIHNIGLCVCVCVKVMSESGCCNIASARVRSQPRAFGGACERCVGVSVIIIYVNVFVSRSYLLVRYFNIFVKHLLFVCLNGCRHLNIHIYTHNTFADSIYSDPNGVPNVCDCISGDLQIIKMSN